MTTRTSTTSPLDQLERERLAKVGKMKKADQEKAARLAEIRQGLETLWTPGGVHEIRGLKVHGRKMTAAGWFDDLGKAAQAALKLEEMGAAGTYLTANPCDTALLARANNRIVEWIDQVTSDTEIVRRRWLPLDFDPHRPSGISATAEEKQAGMALAETAGEMLRARGWPYPLIMDSGNGCYRLVRIDLPNDKETTELLRHVLVGIATLLSPQERDGEPYATLDLAMYNAARIIRLPGTTNSKGDDTLDRPHRHAVLYSPVDECPVDVVSLDLLRAVAALAPEPAHQPARQTTFNRRQQRSYPAAAGHGPMADGSTRCVSSQGSTRWAGIPRFLPLRFARWQW